jgi:hypothetical protein
MAPRRCRTCKFFEPSPVRQKGWCRNPRLYSPQQSRLVDENGLDCARQNEDFWEPSALDGEVASVRSDDTEQARLQLFTRPRRLTPAAETAGVIARSSNSGGSGGGWNSPGGGAGAGDEPPSAPRRPNRTATPQGQERVVSYQPEERYWTDYLRIALPVVGLLLMLGLFWYWASKVIGDTGNSAKPTATAQVAVITAAAPTATTPALVQLTPQPAETATNAAGPATESNSTAANGANAATNGNTANPTTSSGTSNASGNSSGNANGNSSANSSGGNSSSGSNPSQFKKGDTVVTNTGDVNLRADHTTDSEAIDSLAEGTELNVIGDAGVKEGGYTWIQVQDPSTGNEGWVADSLVSAG